MVVAGVVLLATVSVVAGVIVLVIGAGLLAPLGAEGDDRETIFDGGGFGDGGGGGV